MPNSKLESTELVASSCHRVSTLSTSNRLDSWQRYKLGTSCYLPITEHQLCSTCSACYIQLRHLYGSPVVTTASTFDFLFSTMTRFIPSILVWVFLVISVVIVNAQVPSNTSVANAIVSFAMTALTLTLAAPTCALQRIREEAPSLIPLLGRPDQLHISLWHMHL